MRIELDEVIWVESESLSVEQLLERSGLPVELLQELESGGCIEPVDPAAAPPKYGARALHAARRASRLHRDFELDASALLLVLGLLDRVAELETQLSQLQVRMPRLR